MISHHVRVHHPDGSTVDLPAETPATTAPWLCALEKAPRSLRVGADSLLREAAVTAGERRGWLTLYEPEPGALEWRTGRIETWREEAERLRLPDTSVVLVFNLTGEVLGVARRAPVGQWGLPGGKRKVGETPADAAVRELDEEAGLEALRAHLLEVYEGPGVGGHVVRAYLALRWCGRPQRTAEGLEVGWFEPWDLVVKAGPFGAYLTRIFRLVEAFDLRALVGPT